MTADHLRHKKKGRNATIAECMATLNHKKGAEKSFKQRMCVMEADEQLNVTDSDSGGSVGLVVQHTMLSQSTKVAWLVDSGATCHTLLKLRCHSDTHWGVGTPVYE